MSTIVTLPHDTSWKQLHWVKENCPSYITNDVHQNGYNTYNPTKIDYFFGDEQDALWFSLRWV